jgi:hypothetical protein
MSHLVRLVIVVAVCCGAASVFAQEPGEWQWYEADDFSLGYPGSWALVETEHFLQLRYADYALNIEIGRSYMGLSAGEFERTRFIGQYGIPVDLLVYEDAIKSVFYGRLLGTGPMLTIVLASMAGQDVAYEDIAIPPFVVDEANRIVATLTFHDVQQPGDVTVMPIFSGARNPIDTWDTYSHPTEPFAFRYPSSWALQEEDGRIMLARDGVSFTIAYAPVSDPPPTVDPGLWNSGPLDVRVPIHGLHQAIPSQAIDLQADGTAAGVIYEPVLTPDNHFIFWVSAEIRLAAATINEIDLIISTFKTRLPQQATPSS